MAVLDGTNEAGSDWTRCLNEMHPTEDGLRHWPRLFLAEIPGWRPLVGSLTLPRGEGPHPLVLHIHGGGWMTGHPAVLSPRRREMRVFETLLEQGYAVAHLAYRMVGEGAFPMQIHDCAAGVRFFRHHAAHFGLDPARFAALGESAGGHLALLLGVDRPEALEGDIGVTGVPSKVQAVVDWYGPADLMIPYQGRSLAERVRDPENAVGRLLGGPGAGEAEARMASPVTHAGPGAAPCLIQHGTADSIVTYDHAEHMRDALAAAGVPVELQPVDGAEHGFPDGDVSQVVPRMLDFLARHLRG